MSALSRVSSLGEKEEDALGLREVETPATVTSGPPCGQPAGQPPRPTFHPRRGSPSLAPNARRGRSRWDTWTGLDGADNPPGTRQHCPKPTDHAAALSCPTPPSLSPWTFTGPQGPPSPIKLPLEGVQPGLHVCPRPAARAGQGDIEEAGSGGRAPRQLLVLAAAAVPPEAEDVGHS